MPAAASLRAATSARRSLTQIHGVVAGRTAEVAGLHGDDREGALLAAGVAGVPDLRTAFKGKFTDARGLMLQPRHRNNWVRNADPRAGGNRKRCATHRGRLATEAPGVEAFVVVVFLVAGKALEVLQMLIFETSQLQDFFDTDDCSQTQDTLHAYSIASASLHRSGSDMV